MSKDTSPLVFEHESLQDPESIVEYLEALGTGFRAGRLLFTAGKQELVLKTPRLMNFHIKAKQKEDGVKLSLKISWKEHEQRGKNQSPLKIVATEED